MAKRKSERDLESDARRQKTDADKMDSGSAMGDSENDSDEQDLDMVNVDFEYFDPQPQHDFHGLKTLLRTLFDVDAQLFNLSSLADLILSQPLLGSTVKVDGNESDPYAFMSVLNMHEHRGKPIVWDLRKYILTKTHLSSALSASPSHAELSDLLSSLLSTSTPSQVGLILTERLINLPPQITPPMYKMLQEEIAWALEEDEPYQFSHYLILSRVYTELDPSSETLNPNQPHHTRQQNSTSSLASANGAVSGTKRTTPPTSDTLPDFSSPRKKQKQQSQQQSQSQAPLSSASNAAANAQSTFYLHPEDEALHAYALGHCTFQYDRADEDQDGQDSSGNRRRGRRGDSKGDEDAEGEDVLGDGEGGAEGSDGAAAAARQAFRDVGVRTMGHLILIEAGRFAEAVGAVEKFVGGGT